MESSKRTFVRTLAGALVVTAFAAVVFAQAPPVKIGLLATLEGPFAAGGQDGMRGAELAVRQRNGVASSDVGRFPPARPDSRKRSSTQSGSRPVFLRWASA